MPRLKVLFVVSECVPFAKTGGLADVAGALPKALAAEGHDVRIAMPAYASVERMGDAGTVAGLPGGLVVPTGAGSLPAGVFATELPGSRVPVYLIEERPLEVNFMARGIYHATMVNTVSPTYAREIMTPSGGAGLDRLLASRSQDLRGILNGIDDTVWDPATDKHLAAPFDAEHPEGRAATKRALQERLGLPADAKDPPLGMVTR